MEKQRSRMMAASFARYLEEAKIPGHGDYGPLTIHNLGDYIVKEYLIPDCNRYLAKKTQPEIAEYLALRPWTRRRNFPSGSLQKSLFRQTSF